MYLSPEERANIIQDHDLHVPIRGWAYNTGQYDCSDALCGADDCQNCRPGNNEDED